MKLSRQDFLTYLEKSSSSDDLIEQLYAADSVQGRSGVVSVKKSVEIINKKIAEKQKQMDFVDKFGGDDGITSEDLKYTGGFRTDMLY